MKLLGKDVDVKSLVERVEGRLRARGLLAAPTLSRADPSELTAPGIDPMSFNLGALEANADPTAALYPETSGQTERTARWLAHTALTPVLNLVFARQRRFNANVRDAYAQLSAEVIRLKKRVKELEAERAARTEPLAPTGEPEPVPQPARAPTPRPRAKTTAKRAPRRK